MKYLAKLSLFFIKRYSDDITKNSILTEAVKHLFNTISADDVLKENLDGTLNFEDKILDVSYRKNLREQANLLPKMMLWRILQKDIQYQLNKRMFGDVNLKINHDLLFTGKLILWLNEVINIRIKNLQK